MKVGKYFVIIIFLALIFECRAQTLRGTVRDADNGWPLTGATVVLHRGKAETQAQSIATGPSGEFVFEGLRPAYYQCTVSMVGYATQTVTEIAVAAGKEQNLDISMNRTATALPNLTILAPPTGRRPLQPLSEIPLTRDQTLRFPSMYFDPGRLAAAYPGVAQTDDGINGMSIRGNSPASVKWRLEGVDIVNPNHLPNAGTFSDRPAAASGGVLMFSSQLLDNSSLLTGVFPAGYGDALGGIMDMNLRKGNTTRPEFTVQAGLVGLDLAAEGPLGKDSKNSYLVNYRYSTVGLLGKLGVSFGDEQIDFQDLSFNLSLTGKKGSRWTVFGMGGLSENLFAHKTNQSDIKQFKDLFDINFHSKTGVLGVTNWTSLGANTWLKTSVAASSQVNDRTSVRGADNTTTDTDHLHESKISGAVTFYHRFNLRNRVVAGTMITNQYYMDDRLSDDLGSTVKPEHEYVSSQPWVNYIWSNGSNNLVLNAGVHALILPYISKSSIEPRLSLSKIFSEHHRLTLSWGEFSQVAPLWLLKSQLDLLKAWQAGLRYTWTPVTSWAVKGELFWQRQVNQGVDPYLDTYSILNASETIDHYYPVIHYTGLGENKGLELSVEHYLSGDWFMAANTTLFSSRYQGSDKIWRDSRWSLGHLANFTLGKEWYKERTAGKIRAFGLNGRIVWTGGFREVPIDAAASVLFNKQVYDYAKGYSIQLPDYYRIDLRVYWKRSLGNRRNSTFAMDFQNVTNQQNVAYHYYDAFTHKVETKYQLGLIPNISWRLEF